MIKPGSTLVLIVISLGWTIIEIVGCILINEVFLNEGSQSMECSDIHHIEWNQCVASHCWSHIDYEQLWLGSINSSRCRGIRTITTSNQWLYIFIGIARIQRTDSIVTWYY